MSSVNPRKFFVVAILLLAFALRVVAIDRIPPGLSHDEAYNGVTAMQVLDGQRLIFFEINKGIEPLIIYLEALAFSAFGIGPVPMRLINVVCGMLTVVLVYPLAARLFNRRVALLAMAGLAVSFWAIFTSRLALRAVILPPLLMLTLYFLSRSLIHNSQFTIHNSQLFILTGLIAGATMYTYLSSRFVPLLIIALFGYQLLRRQVTKSHWLGLLLLLIIWAAVFAPLANYFVQYSASFTERSSQVSTLPYTLNGDFGPLFRHTLRTLGMFTFHGDETDRYNLDGRPVFDWFNGLFFYLGLGITLLRLRRSPQIAEPAVWVLLWFVIMLLPGFITDDSPHFLRTIGAMPPAYIFWALGVESCRLQVAGCRLQVAGFTSQALRFILPSALILIFFLHSSYDYFVRWANAPEARYIYGADIAEVARYVNATRDKGLVAISGEYYRDLDPFRFALHSRGDPPFVIWFDGRQSLAFPPPGSALSPRYVFPISASPAEAWQPFLLSEPIGSGQEYVLYRLPDAKTLQQAQTTTFPAENGLGIKVNNDLIISAYRVVGAVVSGGKFRVLLAWQALHAMPPGTDYTFLVRLKDNQGNIWAEGDGNGYSPSEWQPGVLGLQQIVMRLPGDLPPRTYHLTLEVVDRQTGQSLPTAMGETMIALGSLRGQLAQTPRILDPEKLPNPLPVSSVAELGSGVTLRGYQVHNPVLSHGDMLALTLHWQVWRQPRQNYRLEFTLVKGNADAKAAAIYRWPALEPIGGEWPTNQWPAEYWVQDRLALPLGSEVPAGQFRLLVNWTDLDSSELPPSFDLGVIQVTD